MPLTAKSVEAIRPGGVAREIPDGLIPGLYLSVQPTGARSWCVRYRAPVTRKTRKLTLGRWPILQLGDARRLAREALLAVAEGGDPAAEKQRRKRQPDPGSATTDTVEAAFHEFVNRYAQPRLKGWKEVDRLLKTTVAPGAPATLYGRRVQDIRRQDVAALIEAIAEHRGGTTGNRTLAAVRRAFGWLAERGTIESSPALGVKPPALEVRRDRVLDDAELAAVWHAAGTIEFPVGPFAKLLLLTAARREEVGGMRWAEIDFAQALWTLPANRSKNGAEHTVPLSPAAVALLRALPKIRSATGHVFSTGSRGLTGYGHAKIKLDAALPSPIGRWTFHDLRRTAASTMARLGTPVEVIERTLNHVSGSFRGVAGTYNRHNYAQEKRKALEAWADFIEALVARERADV
jgi:integrase